MAEYILEKGAKPNKDTIRVQDYLVGTLYTTTEEQGYIEKKNFETEWDFVVKVKGPEKIQEIGTIMIKNTPTLKTRLLSSKATEFLTGVQLDLLSYRLDPTNRFILTRTSNKELDTFVYIFKGNHPTVEQLWEYIQAHKNTEEYKKQLEDLKAQGSLRHLIKQKIEEELEDREEQERLSIRRIG
jgi:hypothetical protein